MTPFNFEEAEKKTQPDTTTTPSFNFEEAEKEAPFNFENAERLQRDRVRQRMGVEPTPQLAQETMPAAVTTEVGGVDITGFGSTLEESLKQDAEPPKIKFKELYTNDDYFNVVQDMQKALGKPALAKGQSKEDYVKDFMDDRRFVEWNSVLGAVPELAKVRNLPEAEQRKIAEGRRLYEETASVFEPGGQAGVRPYWDAVFALVTDPINYIGFGAAKLTQVGGSQLLKGGIGKASTPASKPAIVGAGAIAEGAGQGYADLVQQRLEQETSRLLGEEVQDLSGTRLAIASTFGVLFGGAEGFTVARGGPRKSGEDLKKALERRNVVPNSPDSPPTAAEQALIDPLRDNMDNTVRDYVQRKGAEILQNIDPATPLTDPKIATQLSAAAVRVAMRVIDTDPAFKLKPNEQVSDAIERVFANLDQIDDAGLEQAIRSVGLTPDQFSAANKVTVSEAARVMQQYSVASKMLTRLRQIDPEFNKRVDELYGVNDVTTGAFGTAADVVRAVERESKVWITSGVDTTFRNVAGTSIGLTAKSAAQVMEGLVYSIGHAGQVALRRGDVMGTMQKDVADTFKDAFDVYFYLKNKGLAEDVTDNLLSANPALRDKMLHALQETDNRQISQVGRWANTLNVSQDAYFRRAIFTASVEQQLRRMGIDLYDDVLAQDKLIPTPVLSKAVDDALKATFSYMPKPARADQRTFEKMAEGGGNAIVSMIEKTPLSSLAIPFPRFMANAMAFQYRYSPMGGAGGGAEMLDGYRLIQKGETEKGMKKIRDGQTKVAQGLVGTAALAAAYDYRMENPDTEWYNVKNANGTTTDVRYIFPIAPYFAVADVLARNKQGLPSKTAEAIESVVGMKVPTGTQNTFVDQLIAAVDSERDLDKLSVSIGKVMGDFAGRFTQPFVVKQAYDYFDILRDEGTIARDPNVIETEGGAFETATTAAKQRVMGRLPVIKEQLPESIPRLREGPVYKEGEFFNRMFGFRQMPQKTPAEREVVRVGIDPFRAYGSPSGDRQYDRAFIENANRLVIPRVEQVIANPEYQKLDPKRQREALTNAIRQMTSVARDITRSEMMAKDINRIYKMRFNRLPETQRRIINEDYAKEHDGKTMEQANDFTKLDQYEAMLKSLQFSVGGFLSRTAKEAVQGGASATPRRSIRDIIQERSVQQQTDEALSGTPTQSVSTPETVVPTQATPAPTAPAAPVSSPYDFPNKAFTDAEYAVGEQQMLEQMGDYVKSMKVSDPEGFANTLHAFTAKSKGLKSSEMPPAPYKFEVADDILEAADDASSTAFTKRSPIEEEPTPLFLSEKAKKGSLMNVKGFVDRDDILAQIKEVRQETFPDLRKAAALKGVDDMVIGVTQGDFRFSKGREINPNNSKDIAEFTKMAKTAQKRLETLREKHKNVPSIVLYHGAKSQRGAEQVRGTGFIDPRRLGRSEPGHTELDVSIPSFTRDLNLPFQSGAFGGRDAERFVAFEIPYADYLFSRVNMPQVAYDQKNLNVIARTISGDPKQVRPLGLPRSGMFETEDSIVEAEKLTRGSGRLTLPDDEIVSRVNRFEEIKAQRGELGKRLNASMETFSTDPTTKTANELYRNVRDYTKSLYRNAEMTSTKTGVGQKFEIGFVNMPMLASTMSDAARVLRDAGSTERAELLDKIANAKRRMGQLDEVETKEMQRTRQELMKTIPKLNKGGLVARKR
jgi:hypothetical protein